MNDAIQLDLAKSAAQEDLLVFTNFDEDTALRLGLLVLEMARGLGPIVVDIRKGETPLFFCATPGTTPANSDWARRKRNLVNLVERPSYVVGLMAKQGNEIVQLMALDPRDFTPHGGSFPIRVAGAGMIGTLTISGLPQRDDHKLATDAIAKLLGVDLGEAAF